MKKWIKRIYIGIFILIVLVIALVNIGMSVVRFSDEDAVEYFEEQGFEGNIEYLNINGRQVKVVSDMPEANDSILMVFVHGAPGSWDAYKDYITDHDLMSKGRVIAYDRPGYGGSGASAMPGIQEQADVLKELLKVYGLKKNVLIGHSYGGPVVGLVGLDDPDVVDAVIMIAPLIDPVSEPLHWYSYFSYWKLTSWLLPSELVVAGSEKFAHSAELEKIEAKWQDAETSFYYVHGMKDGLAPAEENIAFAKKNIPKENLIMNVIEDDGHLLIWTNYDMTKGVILDALDDIK